MLLVGASGYFGSDLRKFALLTLEKTKQTQNKLIKYTKQTHSKIAKTKGPRKRSVDWKAKVDARLSPAAGTGRHRLLLLQRLRGGQTGGSGSVRTGRSVRPGTHRAGLLVWVGAGTRGPGWTRTGTRYELGPGNLGRRWTHVGARPGSRIAVRNFRLSRWNGLGDEPDSESEKTRLSDFVSENLPDCIYCRFTAG